MRWTSRSAAVILALASLSLAQEAPDPFLAERILAQNALIHLSVPQSASISGDYAKSNLAKLLDHPEVRPFIASFESWWKRRKTEPVANKPSLNDQSREAIGLSIDEVWGLLQGPLSFSLYDVPLGEPHKLDLVLTLGAPDPAKLERAAAALKDAAKKGGNLQEKETPHAGSTIREFGDEQVRLYYTMLQKTLVVTTQMERMVQMIDAAADKAYAGLREDAVFKVARSRVAADNRHFLLIYLNLAEALKAYRGTLGEPAMKAIEALGLADVPSVAMAMAYDGPFIRERYAVMTGRQDRGLIRLIAGGTPADPFVDKVPVNATSYSHLGLNLGEVYSVIEEASKSTPDFQQAFQEVVGKYEQRVGFKVKEALASVGSNWTGWASMPPGGGLWPDSISAVQLKDPAAFEAALEKALTDAGLPLEELKFRGRRIRYVTIGLEPLLGAMAVPAPEFLSFSTTICYVIDDKTLYLASHPMALKRLILRSGEKNPSILDNPTYLALASRVQDSDGESRAYVDIGHAVVTAYGLLEPFAHLVRDQARDENGDLVVDLAKLPLEETLAALLGGVLMTKRTLQDGILIDSRSNTGASIASGAGLVAISAAVAIPSLMRLGGGAGGGPANNEALAEFTLQFIKNAEETFKNSDSDANGVADYWTRDVAGLHSVKDKTGAPILLLDPATAAADPEGAARYGLSLAPKNGYYFKMMVGDPDGEAYQKDDGKTNKTRFGVVAWPAVPGATGRLTFIMDESGKVWKKDTQGQAVDRWPGKDPVKDGWMPGD
ncbi:MAG TPA: DUF2950 family protein [Planctomycetota bacterium]|nr:DUF2950 family protein [Planctomycetota bacterium]